MWYYAEMAKKKESEFDKLARLIKSESEDVREHMVTRADLAALRREMNEGFAAIIRRLDAIRQAQLDAHAARIKKLETAVFK